MLKVRRWVLYVADLDGDRFERKERAGFLPELMIVLFLVLALAFEFEVFCTWCAEIGSGRVKLVS